MHWLISFESILSLVFQWDMTKFYERFMDRGICDTGSFPGYYLTLPDIIPVISAASTDKSEVNLADLKL